MKKKTVSEIIREEIERLMRETFEAAKGPNDPTDDDEFDAASDAAQQAHDLGLVHTAYGKYEDPKHPEKGTVARSVKGHLVKVEKDPENDVPSTGANAEPIPGGAMAKPDKFTPTSGGTPPEKPPTTPPAPPAPEEPDSNGPQDLHPEAQGIADHYVSIAGSEEAAKVKLEKILKSLDNVSKIIAMRGKHAKKTQRWANNQNDIAKHRDALYILQNQQPSQSSDDAPPPPLGGTEPTAEPETPATPPPPSEPAQSPPGEPGSIDPPLDKNGQPWEVEVNGKKGYIDVIENDRDEAHVTFHDGSFGWFRTNELTPVKKIGSDAPKSEGEQAAAKFLQDAGGDLAKAVELAKAKMYAADGAAVKAQTKRNASRSAIGSQTAQANRRMYADAYELLKKQLEGGQDPKAK